MATKYLISEFLIPTTVFIFLICLYGYSAYVHEIELKPICKNFRIGESLSNVKEKISTIKNFGIRVLEKNKLIEIGIFGSTCTVRLKNKRVTSILRKHWIGGI